MLRAYTALGLARPVANVRTGRNREATETGECAGHGLRIEWFALRLARAGSSSGYRCAIDHVRGRPRAFSVGKGRRLGRRFALSGGVRSPIAARHGGLGARRARSRRFRSRTHPGRPPGPAGAHAGGLAAAWGRQSAFMLEADERAPGPERDEARRAACSSLGRRACSWPGCSGPPWPRWRWEWSPVPSPGTDSTASTPSPRRDRRLPVRRMGSKSEVIGG